MKKDNFTKEFERLTETQKEKVLKFWESNDNADALLKKITDTLFTKLESLNENEAQILFILLNTKDILNENKLQKISNIEKVNFSNALKNLQNKMFIYIRKTIAKLSKGNDKIFIYQPISEIIENLQMIDNFDFINKKINQGYLYINYKDKEILNLFFENLGWIPCSDTKDISTKKLENYLKKGLIDYSLYFNGSKIFPVYHLKEELLTFTEPENKTFSNNGLFFKNTLNEIFYFLSTKNVNMNKNGSFSKYDNMALSNLFNNNENVLNHFIQLLNKMNCISIKNNSISVLNDLKTLIHDNVNSTIKKIANHDSELKWFIDNFLKEKWEFNLYDLKRVAKEQKIEISNPSVLLETAYFIGIIERSNAGTFKPSIIYNGYIHDSMYIHSDEECFIVNPNFTIVAEKSKLCFFDDFLLQTFCSIESEGNVIIFKMDKKTFQKALYIGFNPEVFISLLQKKSVKEIPHLIQTVLNDWINGFRKVKLKHTIVLEGQKSIIDLLFYHNEMKQYIVKRLGDTAIEILPEGKNVKVIEDEEIFIIPEDI